MLTHEDHPASETDTAATADTRPVLRRLGHRYSNWLIAALLVFGLPAAGIAIAAAPFVALLVLAGLAFTVVRYVVQRDWAALRHIAFGVALLGVGYVVARASVHAGIPTVQGWTERTQNHADAAGDAGAHGRSILLSVEVLAAWVGSMVALVVGGFVTVYALVRPYRTRIPSGAVLVGCAMVGALVGLIG